jgi:hypothetical protein
MRAWQTAWVLSTTLTTLLVVGSFVSGVLPSWVAMAAGSLVYAAGRLTYVSIRKREITTGADDGLFAGGRA